MKNSFINSRGLEVFCKPIAAEYTKSISENIRADYIERGEPIEPPKRWVPKMGGGVMPEPLTNFLDPKNGGLMEGNDLSEEEKEALLKHLDALRRLEADRLEALVNAYGLEGIDLPEVPLTWIKRQKLIRNPIPTDQDELKLQYVKSELVVTFPWGDGEGAEDSDFAQLSTICQALAFKGLSKEAEEQFRSRFRRRASGSENRNGDTPGGTDPATRGELLELQPGDANGPDSRGLRPASELVREPIPEGPRPDNDP